MSMGGLAKHKGLRSSKLKPKYAAYRARGVREINKRRRIERHLKRFPKDNVARMRLGELK